MTWGWWVIIAIKDELQNYGLSYYLSVRESGSEGRIDIEGPRRSLLPHNPWISQGALQLSQFYVYNSQLIHLSF